LSKEEVIVENNIIRVSPEKVKPLNDSIFDKLPSARANAENRHFNESFEKILEELEIEK
jgi:hypothetical protein